MIVEFERTGGVSGVKLGTSVDTNDLPNDEASHLIKMINKLKPQRLEHGKPDRYVYKIKIINGESISTIPLTETPEHSELLEYLSNKAKDA